jgi:hypothetical protein
LEQKMNRITAVVSLATIAIFGPVSQAQSTLYGTSTRVGNTTFHSWSNGTSGTIVSVGSTKFHRLSTGVTGTTQRIGTTSFHSFSNGARGTTQRVGASSFTRLDGSSVISTRIGNTDFHNSSAGLGTTTRIGTSKFTTLPYQPVNGGMYVPRRLSGR